MIQTQSTDYNQDTSLNGLTLSQSTRSWDAAPFMPFLKPVATHTRKYIIETRSTGTMHTSAKARLISVTIQIHTHHPDCYQNLIICSLAHCQRSLKISCKSVSKVLRKVANKQTDKQGRLHILLGGCNNFKSDCIQSGSNHHQG